MGAVLDGRGWKLRLADGWTAKRESAGWIVFPPDNGPVVSINTSKIDGGVTDSLLRHLVRDLIQDGRQPQQVQLGDFDGLAFRYIEDDFYWRHWMVKAGSLMLDINYDCALGDRGKHDPAIDNMLSSLAVEGDAI